MNLVTPEIVIAKAKATSGLGDFGGTSFLEGLQRALAAIATLPLKSDAREEIEAGIVQDLVNRLRIQDWITRHPDVMKAPIEGPVLVTGLPRTGTTATVALLALDPRFRFTRAWEGHSPIPPPESHAEKNDPRAVAARARAKRFALASMHLDDPDGPEEDMVLLAGLDCRNYFGRLPMPADYLDWWAADDFRSTYEWHSHALRLLQSRRPPNLWLLKSPVHLFKLEAFAARYPGARFVMTHRDPAKVVSSVASFSHALYEGVCEPESAALNRRDTGRRCLSFWAEGMRRGLDARARIGDDRFIDVDNRDVIRDPVTTLERVYDQLEMTVTPTLKGAWVAYQQENAQGKFGGHDHNPEDFGLDAPTIRSAFSDYIARFGV